MASPGAQPVPVVLPDTLWEAEGDVEAVLVGWLAEDGAAVEAGAVVAEIMVEKVTVDVEAPASGRLEVVAPVDAAVRLGDVIAWIHP